MKLNDFVKFENGSIAQIVVAGEGNISRAEVLDAKYEDASVEKHVPYIEEKESGYLVKVGKEAKHPMLEAHWIQFIEIEIDDTYLYRRYLKAGEEPEVFFEVPKGKKVVAREYCNLHGLWVSSK